MLEMFDDVWEDQMSIKLMKWVNLTELQVSWEIDLLSFNVAVDQKL